MSGIARQAPNPRKTTSIRQLGKVDIEGLLTAMLAIPEAVWDAENSNKPNKFEALERTQHIVFRFVDSTRDWRGSHDRPLWTEWRFLLEPVLTQAVDAYDYVRGEYPRVMFARMAPGGVIQPHVDTNSAAKWPHKIHVPLTTNDRVSFLIGDSTHHFPAGEAVEVNNLGPHAVYNRGETDRVHLIFEYYDADQAEPDWLAPFLMGEAARSGD